MFKEKISFIIPVYNVEQYLSRCLKSIVNQSYKNIEIIIINDGSLDNSQDIIEKFKQGDERIITVNKKNEGVSKARNIGLKMATGEYILFIDSDDFIDKNYAIEFLKLIKKDDCDIAVSYNYYDDRNSLPKASKKYKIIDGDKATEQLYVKKMDVAVWNKIYKTDFLKKYNICFDTNLWFGEGMTFNIECFQKAKRIATNYIKVYHQTPNPNSAVRKFNLNSWHCGMKAMEYQYKIINISNKKIHIAWQYHYRNYYYSILVGIYTSHNENIYDQEIQKCKKKLKHNILYPFLASTSFKEKIRWIIITINPMILIKRKLRKKTL